jgi:hypothetical protein
MLGFDLKMPFSSAATALAGFLMLSGSAQADPVNLSGTWSGSGSVQFASGAREKARCRASFTPSSSKSYRVSGTCATQSGKVTQNAEVFRMTAERYRGNFHNPEFDISGTISINMHGERSMTATLTTSNGTGVLVMRR